MRISLKSLYYIAFILLLILRWATCSVLITLSPNMFHLLVFFIVLLFIGKIVMEPHSKKEYLLIILLTTLFTYIYLITDMYYLLTSFLAFAALKDVSIKKVIIIDIVIKLIFITGHSLLYFLDYIFDYEKVLEAAFITEKGIRHTMYFSNPNTFGVILVWIIIDILYLSEKLSFKSVAITFLIMLIGYKLTQSRTAFYVYIIYIVLSLIKTQKVVDILNKYCYYFLAAFSFFIVKFLNINSSLYKFLNTLFSNRLKFSMAAFDSVGLKFLPNYLPADFFELYIIDNFYVRCFICFGILTLIIVGIPQFIMPKNKFYKEKIISIVSSIYLFSENVTINVGFAVPFLIIGDTLINRKNEDLKLSEKLDEDNIN